MFSKLDLIERTSATGGKLRCHASENSRFYTDAWEALDAWIYDVFTQGKCARIPRFAVFGWEILGTGTIGGGAHKPYFLLNLSTDPLSTGFEDRARVSTAIDEFDPLTIAMKHSRLCNKDMLADGVADLLKTFRLVCRANGDMSVEFSVGRFVSRGGATQFHFDAGLCGRVAKSVGFALESAGGGRPPSSFPSTAKGRYVGTPLLTRPPVSPLTPSSLTVPRLPLARSSSLSDVALSTRRLVVDPSKAKRLVADAAYQRHMELIRQQQDKEMRSQQQYDMEVMELDCDILNAIVSTKVAKKELKSVLDVQLEESRARRRLAAAEEHAPVDVSSGSILPTMDLRKYAKFADAALPEDLDLSRMSLVDAAAFKTQYFEQLAAEEKRKELKDTLDSQLAHQRELTERRKREERALERRLVHEVSVKEAEDYKSKMESRLVAGQALKASWDREKEVRELVAQKQREMIERANRWRADMTHKLARTYRETGEVDLRATVNLA